MTGRQFPISDEIYKKVGKIATLESVVMYPNEYGGGIMAGLEVFHHLHCLVNPDHMVLLYGIEPRS